MINVDLLPSEFRTEEIKRAKFLKIQSLGIGVILLMIFISSLIVALRVLQSQRVKQVQNNLTTLEQRINDLKTTQASLILLKDRLNAITKYLGVSSKQTQAYLLVNQLLPSSTFINSLSVDGSGQAVVIASVPDSSTLDNLVDNLTSKEINEDKVTQVVFESINRIANGGYRVSMKIGLKI